VYGEELVTHRFPTSSIGLASPLDLMKADRDRREPTRGAPWWQRLNHWLNPPPLRIDRVPAVCIPPGARLALRGVPRELQKELGVGAKEEVTFVKLSASAYRYRDGIRFRNGREILLQCLEERLPFVVLSLEFTEDHHEEMRPEQIEHVRIRVR